MKAASPIESALARQLLDGRGPDGAWGYYAGHTARLEPTCWAMLALGACDALASAVPDLIRVADFLKGAARDDGLLVDSVGVPPNLASNGLAALTRSVQRYGVIEPGAVGSLTLIDTRTPWTVCPEHLGTRAGWSPFEGVELPARAALTVVRGTAYGSRSTL